MDAARNTKPAADVSAAADIAPDNKPANDISPDADIAHRDKPAAAMASAADIAHDGKVVADASTLRDAGDPALRSALAQEPARPVSAAPTLVHSATTNPQAAPQPPAPVAAVTHMSQLPIAIFISRKTAKLYVRQDFKPVFTAPVTIEKPDQPFGTLVFTALQYLPDQSGFVWNVVAMPGERPKPKPVGKFASRVRAGRSYGERRHGPAAARKPGSSVGAHRNSERRHRPNFANDRARLVPHHLGSGPWRRNWRRHQLRRRDALARRAVVPIFS